MPGESAKGRKIGRNKISCKHYKDSKQKLKNQLRRLFRHLRQTNRDHLQRHWITDDIQKAYHKILAVLSNAEIKAIKAENPRNNLIIGI